MSVSAIASMKYSLQVMFENSLKIALAFIGLSAI